MSMVFLACTGQPMSQRARFSQPPCCTPLNGWARGSPKCTAIGSSSRSFPTWRPAAAKASTLRRAGSGGVVTGSSAASVRWYQGSMLSPVIAAGQ